MNQDHRIAATYWTGESARALKSRPHALYLKLYLLTCPSINILGIAVANAQTIADHTYMSAEQILSAAQVLSAEGSVLYDHEWNIFFVPGFTKHQLGESLSPKDKRRTFLIREAKATPNHVFKEAWVARYAEIYELTNSEIKEMGITQRAIKTELPITPPKELPEKAPTQAPSMVLSRPKSEAPKQGPKSNELKGLAPTTFDVNTLELSENPVVNGVSQGGRNKEKKRKEKNIDSSNQKVVQKQEIPVSNFDFFEKNLDAPSTGDPRNAILARLPEIGIHGATGTDIDHLIAISGQSADWVEVALKADLVFNEADMPGMSWKSWLGVMLAP